MSWKSNYFYLLLRGEILVAVPDFQASPPPPPSISVTVQNYRSAVNVAVNRLKLVFTFG
jgi:hypothetical protein